MKKRIIPTAILLALLLSIGVSAAQPRAVVVTPSLSFEGTTADCWVSIVEAGSEISATLTLWRGNRVIDSWSGEGTSSVLIGGSCTVNEGLTYTLRVTGMVDGEPLEVVSITRTC